MTGFEVVPAVDAPADAERVLATRGDSSTCWCQWFRIARRGFDALPVDEKRDRFRRQVRDGRAGPGVVAFRDGAAVGWCAVAPRADYPVVGRSRLFRSDDVVVGTWVVTCFVVPPEHRRQGVAHALLDGAVAHARSHGAAVVEGSPVDVTAMTHVEPDALYHGTVPLFTAHGFEVVAHPSPTRALVRLSC